MRRIWPVTNITGLFYILLSNVEQQSVRTFFLYSFPSVSLYLKKNKHPTCSLTVFETLACQAAHHPIFRGKPALQLSGDARCLKDSKRKTQTFLPLTRQNKDVYHKSIDASYRCVGLCKLPVLRSSQNYTFSANSSSLAGKVAPSPLRQRVVFPLNKQETHKARCDSWLVMMPLMSDDDVVDQKAPKNTFVRSSNDSNVLRGQFLKVANYQLRDLIQPWHIFLKMNYFPCCRLIIRKMYITLSHK